MYTLLFYSVAQFYYFPFLQVPVLGRDGSPRGRRSLPGGFIRGHQPLHHPRQEGHHHAQRHPAGQEDQGGGGLGDEYVWFLILH